MKIDIDCKEASRLISGRMDDSLPPADSARLRLHFVLCKACRTVDEQMRFLRQAMTMLDGSDRNG